METRTANEVRPQELAHIEISKDLTERLHKANLCATRWIIQKLSGGTMKLHNRSRKPLARLKHALGMIQFPQITIE